MNEGHRLTYRVLSATSNSAFDSCLSIPCVSSEREKSGSQQFRQHPLTRREIEAPEASRLARSESEVRRLLEFLTNELNDLSE
jgi:hypothetical protein